MAEPDAGREALAKAQAELMRALVAGAKVPEGFDAAQVTRAARSLGRKKERVEERRRRQRP